METNEITKCIIGCAIEVHKALGPGLLESAYESCLAEELRRNNIRFERQKPISIDYKDLKVATAYYIDLFVEDQVIVELKAVEKIHSIHEAQLLTYMKLNGCKIGLLINFNTVILVDGIKRMILNTPS